MVRLEIRLCPLSTVWLSLHVVVDVGGAELYESRKTDCRLTGKMPLTPVGTVWLSLHRLAQIAQLGKHSDVEVSCSPTEFHPNRSRNAESSSGKSFAALSEVWPSSLTNLALVRRFSL